MAVAHRDDELGRQQRRLREIAVERRHVVHRGDVERAVAQLRERVRHRHFLEMQAYVRHRAAKCGDRVRQRRQRDRRHRADRDAPGHFALDLFDRFERAAHVAEQLLRARQQRVAAGRQLDAAHAAHEQLGVERGFELADRMRDRRLRDAEFARGGAQALVMRGADEGLQLRDVQVISDARHRSGSGAGARGAGPVHGPARRGRRCEDR
ncbi:hypothetical protein FEP65_00605 [Burkholderia multivorans]|nr:hypothetical protein [Burkholderia multivorans]